MDLNPVILSIPLYFLLIGLELIFQTVKKVKLYRTNDAITNISCGISSQVTNALWGVLSIGMYEFVSHNFTLISIPDTWWSWLVLFVLVDLMYYWFHRASHEINFLWNTAHVVHHQSEDYNLSVALRQSSFGGVFSMVFYLPLAVMGFSSYAFLTVKGLNLIYQFWIHTEAIRKLPRWFEYLFNTPSHHRVHHGRNPKYIDRNHAGTLMIWDRLFGTFQAEEETPTYGVTKPINTWNPVWANVLPILDMIKQFAATPGISNKLKVLFYKPGWQPMEQGGYQPAPELSTVDTTKFDLYPNLSMIRYAIGQFALTLGFTTLFLFTSSGYSYWMKWLFAGFIIWSILALGLLMEDRKWMRYTEVVRIFAGGALIFWAVTLSFNAYMAGGFILLSLAWLLIANKRSHLTI